MRVPGMRDARRNAQASDCSGRPTATAYLPCVNHRMWNKRRLALLARCLTARECKLSRTHIHRLSAVYARTPTASHRMSHPLSSACCVVLHVCRPLFSCRRISAPHVLAASYCLIRTARCGLSYSCSYLHLARPAELQVTSVPTHNRHGGESRDGRTLPWLSCPPLSRTPWFGQECTKKKKARRGGAHASRHAPNTPLAGHSTARHQQSTSKVHRSFRRAPA